MASSSATTDDAGPAEVAEPPAPTYRLRYPPELPVSQRKDDLARAIRDSQVVVVAGETGSGKTTQLPKICLELGRGRDGKVIGHTQPRRIAARTVAERIAEELATPLGEYVGYKVRFTDRSSDATAIKVMTDGILLAEIQSDRMLRRYDTLIIDEAHERSLNIDFLLGYLKSLLPRRPDLKVVITSATIDPERFARHFGDAPVVEVSGRTYPVEVRYREFEDDQTRGVTDAVQELMAEGPGDILVFCSGEREIRDAADALGRVPARRGSTPLEILPLYARLSAAEQHRVFAPHGNRRVVLATNVAETSLTVPGIRYVVDTGLARISRYSTRSKVQRLPIEPISQASARQRAGRCGRVAPGICIRLYAEDDFAGRPEFTEPEILRTNLASVILQMAALGLGDIARFPFVEPPDTRSVAAGVSLLEEIGALRSGAGGTGKRRGRSRGSAAGSVQLTRMGRQLAQLPVDPRLGRMLVEADRNGCLRDVVIVVAALSMQDPRERPADAQEAADAKHRRFADPTSDFAGLLNLWRYLQEQQHELSSSAFRRLCRADYLNYLRVREWQDLDGQLRQVAKSLGFGLSRTPGSAKAIHRSLLAGLLSHVGLRDDERRDYLGARGTRFAVFPGSALFKKQPPYVMAAELVETGRLWARTNARIEPEWAEQVGAHLVKRSHSEPHWSKSRGAVMAREKVTLYGVPLVADRLVPYGRIDLEASRDLFIRHALVQGEWHTHHAFWHANARLLEEAELLEHRARRRGIVVDEESLVDFYDARVPHDVASVASFDAWWKQARRKDPELLSFTLDMLLSDTAEEVRPEDYPTVWRHGDAQLPLDYTFDPGARTDGVTLDVPVALLPAVRSDDFSWPVPGLREEAVVALLRSLPKALRVNFVPAPDHAREFLRSTTAGQEPLLDALERYLRRRTGVVVPRSAWDLAKLPPHLRLSFRVVDEAGAVIEEGKDLDALRERLSGSSGQAISSAAAGLERSGLTSWDLEEVPRTFVSTRAGHSVTGYPALVDDGTTVSLRVFATEREQAAWMPRGLRRLLMLAVPSPGSRLVDGWSNADKLTLQLAPHPTTAALVDDCWAAAVDDIIAAAAGPVWDRPGFEALVRRVGREAEPLAGQLLAEVRDVSPAAAAVSRRLSGPAELALLGSLTDLKGQLERLVYPGFVADAGRAPLRSYRRYLAAMDARYDRLSADPRRDATLMASMAGVQTAYLDRVAALPDGQPPDDRLRALRWMLEELRVSLWAQSLGTAFPVSVPRVERALSELDGAR